MIDWDTRVLAPLEAVFGEEIPVLYQPVAGVAYEISGIFDEAYTEVALAGGMGVTTERPVLGVRLSRFVVPPAQDDRVTIRGLTYVVKEMRPDSHGAAKLMLNWIKG